MDDAPPDRRSAIMAVAAGLFATKGVGATTVRDIGERAGVLSGSLYHYFRSKDAIVAELMAGFMDDIQRRFAEVAATAGSPLDVVRGLIHETLAVIRDHPEATAIYQQDRQYLRDHGLLEPIDSASLKVRGFWLDAVSAGIEDGTFRADVPAEMFYRAVRDTLWATTHWPSRGRQPDEELERQLTALFLDGFRAVPA